MRRTSTLRSVLTGSACALALVSSALAETRSFDIPAGDLGAALDAYVAQSGVQLIYKTDDVKAVKTKGVKGALSPEDALARLVRGTPLEIRRDPSGAVAIVPPGGDSPPRPNRLGAASQASPSEAGSGVQPEEIVVTAQKRGAEDVRNVPVPVTIIRAEKLVDKGQTLLRDYYSKIPNLNIIPNIEGNTNVIIRGVSASSFGNPTVSILVDDVPYTGSTGAYGNQVPDIDPGDLARIEVLRGPQGTLYGANSMGGLLKFVTKDPSTESYSGRVEAGFNAVHNGAELGYDFRASGNLPISETLAIRVSGFRREDPGYIDNVLTGQKGVNEAKVYGGRLSILWRPWQDFSLKLNALYQDIDGQGLTEIDKLPGLGDLQQSYIRGTGWNHRTNQAYSVTLNYTIGNVDLTSVTGYGINRFTDAFDVTNLFGKCCTSPLFGVSGTAFYDLGSREKLTEEFRISGTIWQDFDWLLGAYYADESGPGLDRVKALNSTGQVVGELYRDRAPSTYTEYAAFADITYHVTDQFDVQIGARESRIIVNNDTGITEGPLYGPAPVIAPPGEATAVAFTYLLTPRFRISPDFMVYARLASGFRPGAPNSATAIVAGATAAYNPDRTQNYEIGFKGDVFDHALFIDASFYYIDWEDIQIQLTTPGPLYRSYEANGSGAKSEGVELSVTARPLSGLTISGWVSYDDAVLTQAFPANSPVSGQPGDRLPNSSRFSGYISLEQDFPLWDAVVGFVGGEVSYVGDRANIFAASGQRNSFPAYAKTDLSAGVKYDSWTASAYVNNVADVRGLLDSHIGNNLFPFAYVYIPLRTIGVSLSKAF